MPSSASSCCRLFLADREPHRADLIQALNDIGVSAQEYAQGAADFGALGLLDMDVLLEITGQDLGMADYFPEIAQLKTWKAFGCVHPDNNQPILILTRKKTQHVWEIIDANDELVAKLPAILSGSKCAKNGAVQPAMAPSLDVHTILLVDDEAMVRHIIRRVLQDNGFFVLEAAHGNDALLLAQQFPLALHVLVTDLSMPKMNGRDLAARLSTVHPEAGVLFFSGYLGGHLPSDLSPDPAMDFLQKPFTQEVLLRKVEEIMSRKK